MQHVACRIFKAATVESMEKTMTPTPDLKLPPVPADLARAKQDLENARAELRAAAMQRDGIAGASRYGEPLSTEVERQIAALDGEIGRLQSSVDAASEVHAAHLRSYADEARNALAPDLDEYERAVTRALGDLLVLLEQGAEIRHAARSIGFPLNSRAIDLAPKMFNMLGAPAKLVETWRR